MSVTTAYASAAIAASVAKPAPNSQELIAQISDSAKQTSFDPLLKRWQALYGSAAVPPLLKLAAAEGPEPQRYVALMGAARLGGRSTATQITPFLKDRSWMLRSGALRALSALRAPETASQVLPLLHDASLAVRLEAVSATVSLRPVGAAAGLLQELASGDNYRAGKALWVPGRALAALSKLRATEAAPRLSPLLDHAADPDLQIETVATLETLTGRVLMPGAPLQARVQAWKKALASR